MSVQTEFSVLGVKLQYGMTPSEVVLLQSSISYPKEVVCDHVMATIN